MTASYPRKTTKLSLDGTAFGWVCTVFVHALQFGLSQPKSTVIYFVTLYSNFFFNDELWVKGWALTKEPKALTPLPEVPMVLLPDNRT